MYRRAMATSYHSMTIMLCLILLFIETHEVTAELTQALCSNYNTGSDFADGKDLATFMRGSLTVAKSCDHSDKRLPVQWGVPRNLQIQLRLCCSPIQALLVLQLRAC